MGSSSDVIACELSFIMPRIARILTSSFAYSVDLPPAQIFALLELQERCPCRISYLSAALHASAPTVTGILDRMEKAGYVRREHDMNDRRAVNVKLTAAGRKTAVRIRKSIQTRWKYILKKMPGKDAQTYLRIVKKIQGQLDSSQETKIA